MKIESPVPPDALIERLFALGTRESAVGDLTRSDGAVMVHSKGRAIRCRLARGPAPTPSPVFNGNVLASETGSIIEGRFEYRSATGIRIAAVLVALALVGVMVSGRAAVDVLSGQGGWGAALGLFALPAFAGAVMAWRRLDRAARAPYERDLCGFLDRVANGPALDQHLSNGGLTPLSSAVSSTRSNPGATNEGSSRL